jgi:D-sedoheptulose 7-phosphate isomerase
MGKISAFAVNHIKELKQILDRAALSRLDEIFDQFITAYENDRTIFVMGNGGSGATASHFACDINKGVCCKLSKKFKVICLNDNIPTLLAYANDTSYDKVFVEQLKNFFKPGDIVIGFSGSGNSANVINAIEYANNHDGITIAFTGSDGGKMAKIARLPLIAPAGNMQNAEESHLIFVHILMLTLYDRFDSKKN